MSRFFERAVRWTAAVLAVLFLGACERPTEPPASPSAPFTLDVLSTGKSDCLLLRMEEQVVLIDTADEDDGPVIGACLDRYGIKKIDLLLLTHYDNDHVGGAPYVLRNYSVSRVVGPSYRRDSKRMEALYDALDGCGLRLEMLTEEFCLTGEKGSLRVCPTSLALDPEDESDENNQSLILYATYEGRSFLLLGDAMKDRLVEWNRQNEGLPADFVKLPHHGDYYKVLSVLLSTCEAAYAVSCVPSREEVEEKLDSLCQALALRHYVTAEGSVHAEVLNGELTVAQTTD